MSQFDSLQSFLFTQTPIRGQIVRLKASFAAALATANYPEILKHLLGESICAAPMLSSIIKFEGKVSLQAQGTGLLTLLFAQSDENFHVRALAHFNPHIAQPTAEHFSLPELLGNGKLVITLEPALGERYQGIVNLSGATFADCLQDYFQQSEQISTFIVFKVMDDVASGLMLQRLPIAHDDTIAEQEAHAAWEECVHFASTISAKELCHLDNAMILHRLFSAYDIQIFDSKPVSFRCSCSREKIIGALTQLGEQEVLSLLTEQQGQIVTHCEFCNHQYLFDEIDVRSIFHPIGPSSSRKQ